MATKVQAETLTVVEGNGQVVQLDREASSIFIGDPGVADVRVVSGTALFLAGIAPGATNVFALDFEDRLIAKYRIRVLANTESANAALRSGVPNNSIRLQSRGNTTVIRGQANSLDEAFAALDARRHLEGEGRLVVDQTTLKGGTQISLRVRFVEASRSDLFQLGFDLSALGSVNGNPIRVLTGSGIAQDFMAGAVGLGESTVRAGISGGNVDLVLSALERQGVIHILSEPTLTTTSGTRASFRAGGEFAFPVNQGNGVISAEYKQYGVSIDFLPTLLPNRRIALQVSPEVSFIDQSVGVDIAGFAAPSISVRRAETTVEVGSGQTFAIAGLYEQFSSDSDGGVPGVRKAPLFGALFNKRAQRRSERELVIFITPFLADASDASAGRRNPEPNILDTVGFIVK